MIVRVAAARMAPVLGDSAASGARSAAAIEAAAAAGAALVVLPELCSSGYRFADATEAARAAEPVPGPTTERWAALATGLGVVVVGGVCERDDAGRLRNSVVVVDAAGVRAVYRKLHLWGSERELFVAGDAPAPVVETAVGRIGLAVCYDLWFPEQTRGLALSGAEILAVPANLTDGPRQPGLPHLDVIAAIATAHLNRVHVVLADRCGEERGESWLGAAAVVDASGRLLAGPPAGDDAALALADVDLAAACDKRWGDHNDLMADRRPDCYSTALVEPADAGG
ncbi:MAG: Nitrilase/cyanide hydratase and apolipoprotein N-acyltransferase [Frondihabitans sp.]|nr:Nitrilase/cyanide hydratase and apolipoprotein N-acyltransferase [Frondihabitans sp.]